MLLLKSCLLRSGNRDLADEVGDSRNTIMDPIYCRPPTPTIHDIDIHLELFGMRTIILLSEYSIMILSTRVDLQFLWTQARSLACGIRSFHWNNGDDNRSHSSTSVLSWAYRSPRSDDEDHPSEGTGGRGSGNPWKEDPGIALHRTGREGRTRFSIPELRCHARGTQTRSPGHAPEARHARMSIHSADA